MAERIRELDGVRGLAIASVLVWHYLVCQVAPAPGSPVAYVMKALSFSWAGVDLFFVLSGFLVGGILIDNRESRNYFRVFFVRRFFRIVPVYSIVLLCFMVGVALNLSSRGEGLSWLFDRPLPLWSYALYLQNFVMAQFGDFGPHWMGVTWSLAIEEQFYILLPILVWAIPPRALPALVGVLVVVAPVIRSLLFISAPEGGLAGYVLLPGRWDALFLGVLGAHLVRNRKALSFLSSHLRGVQVVSYALLGIVAALLYAGQGVASAGMSYFGHTALALLGLALILISKLAPHGWISRALRLRTFAWLGKVSYAVYLLHQIVAGLLHASLLGQAPRMAGIEDLVVTLLALAVTLALALVSWHFLEAPLLGSVRRYKYEN